MKHIKNFHVSVKELQNKIIFLRKMVPGGSEHSFGIHVAQMAGMPEMVTSRATEILHQLESQRENIEAKGGKAKIPQPVMQLKLFEYDDPIGQKLKEEFGKIEINSMTPVEALMKLNYLRSLVK
jgi:DNA mismatch repair protein MutS